MTKLYRSQVKIELDARQQPRPFRWLGRWHRIMLCTINKEERHWWGRLNNQEPQRYHCETYQGMVCDLFLAKDEGTWVLERVWD